MTSHALSNKDQSSGYNSKCQDSEQKLVRNFLDPLEYLVTIASVLLLPYKFKNISKGRIFSKPR